MARGAAAAAATAAAVVDMQLEQTSDSEPSEPNTKKNTAAASIRLRELDRISLL